MTVQGALLAAISLLLCACTATVLAQGEYDEANVNRPLSVWQQSRQAQWRIQREYAERLKQLVAAEPDNLSHRLDLGRAYYWLALERDAQAQSEAEQAFGQIIERDPNNALALAYHGALLGLKLGSNIVPQNQLTAVMNQAHEELDRAVRLAPDSIEVRELRGYASFYTPSVFDRDSLAVEDFMHAVELLERAPDTETARAKLHLVAGDAYNKMGAEDKARANWERAVRLAPNSGLALAAEARLRGQAGQPAKPDTNFNELIAFFGFFAGVIIFALLSVMALRDLRKARRRRGMLASLLVSVTALLWNGVNLTLVTAEAIGAAQSLPPAGQWRDGLLLAFSLSPIPFGIFAAYRFYKATFIDIVLKRGAALFVLLALGLPYAQLVEAQLLSPLLRMTNPALRSILLTAVWIGLIALYPALRDYIYGLFDRYLFKRRSRTLLLETLNERLHAETDKVSLLRTAAGTLRNAFACREARFIPKRELNEKWTKQMSERNDAVLFHRRVESDDVEIEASDKDIELALAIRVGCELSGAIMLGERAYGQDYLSEDLSLLRAAAAQISRALENLNLHEARRKHAVAEEELRKLVAESELKALRAQIDPHFFFNALNSVAGLISRKPAAAEEMIEDLADLFRHSFKPSRDFIMLGEELQLVETYLKVEKMRLGEKLQYRKTVSPDALAVKIPALTVQPLVENAVKHGIGNSRDGGSVTLSAAVKNDCLSIIVSDTGAGISPSLLPQIFSRGVGLGNVNDRLVKIYRGNTRLNIDSLCGQGTTVSFTIPLTAQKEIVAGL
jgi:signal transduction histidine kinase/tetratricopeptide (TPR) repeat protein